MNVEITKPRRRFRFWLRTLLIFVTLLSLLLGWVGWEIDQRRKEKKVVASLEGMGWEVLGFLSEFDERSWWTKTKDRCFGERVQGMEFARQVEAGGAIKINSVLDRNKSLVTEISLLSELKSLEVLFLTKAQINDLSPLKDLSQLKCLYLSAIKVSDLTPLAGLKNLETLHLRNTQVSDLSPLAGLKNLRNFTYRNAQISEEQVQELKRALPTCEIYNLGPIFGQNKALSLSNLNQRQRCQVRDKGVRDKGVRDKGVRDKGVRDKGVNQRQRCQVPIRDKGVKYRFVRDKGVSDGLRKGQ